VAAADVAAGATQEAHDVAFKIDGFQRLAAGQIDGSRGGDAQEKC
jgi:hypothetical protein